MAIGEHELQLNVPLLLIICRPTATHLLLQQPPQPEVVAAGHAGRAPSVECRHHRSVCECVSPDMQPTNFSCAIAV